MATAMDVDTTTTQVATGYVEPPEDYMLLDCAERGDVTRLAELLRPITEHREKLEKKRAEKEAKGEQDEEEENSDDSSSSSDDFDNILDVNTKDEWTRLTPLQVAIANAQLEAARLLLEAGADPMSKCEGNPPLHMCIALAGITGKAQVATDLFKLLLNYDAAIMGHDSSHRNVLHLAAWVGLSSIVSSIAEASAEKCKNLDYTLGTEIDHVYGDTALHTAARYGQADIIPILCKTAGITPNVNAENYTGETPLHLASKGGFQTCVQALLTAGASKDAKDERGQTPADLAQACGFPATHALLSSTPYNGQVVDKPVANTLLVDHETCTLHFTATRYSRRRGNEPPPENTERLAVLLDKRLGVFNSNEFTDRVDRFSDPNRATISDLLRCHEYCYVQQIMEKCSKLPSSAEGISHRSQLAHLDGDTAISSESYQAALRAAGAVTHAIDQVVSGKNRNAFCAVRPPGHHAGPYGVVKSGPVPACTSYGFCLFNNVAVGAAYALNVHRHQGIHKVAILDIDVHHGNGTEAIIHQLKPAVETQNVETEFASIAVKRWMCRPWKDVDDVDNVFFASAHGFGGDELLGGGSFYPGSGRTNVTSETQTPTGQVQAYNIGLVPGEKAKVWRRQWRDVIFPRLLTFSPDLILISAGFDAHKRDAINCGMVGLIESDYEWFSDQVVKIANTCCNGRVVSVLEGGYRVQGKVVSPFARSVASHVRGLAKKSLQCYDPSEREHEVRKEEEERERKRQEAAEERARQDALVAKMLAAQAAERGEEMDPSAVAALSADIGDSSDMPPRRKRARVDYKALAAQLDAEKASRG